MVSESVVLANQHEFFSSGLDKVYSLCLSCNSTIFRCNNLGGFTGVSGLDLEPAQFTSN